ncbi:hypothetical protein FA13DRAFT_730115 [Coprinellus micaceus]|uniref:IMS import disulfide relay-system CHCH-CHCH-like Cx9C domain-containing protein n=1 Tax=Coprinellus micaceus TaxID=71717 RepID=A0A4Y7TXA9_COPMI|nr:hypothetical protein FA13DRAFT_730115 [Coprinellus micaceus]
MNAANTSAKPARPIARLAYASTVTCAAQASVYGKCITASYMDVTKDMCAAEFAKFKDCLREAVRLVCFTSRLSTHLFASSSQMKKR